MPNNWFQFKQFKVEQDQCAMKIGTDSILLGAWANCLESRFALDIGTGTGILALMIAQKSIAEIIAIDIDEKTIIQAQENITNSSWNNRIKLLNTSLQEFKSPIEKYDFIISNPPFFQNSLKAPDESRTIARHSDKLSHEDIIGFCIKHLSDVGILAIIFPVEQGKYFLKLAIENQLFCKRLCEVKPNTSKQAHRLLMEFSLNKQSTEYSEIIIETGTRHHYTEEYKELTKDFYLHFKY
ncbi:MAG: methyltransferase [Bacteroidia bacterium]|nr:methyltransferase [Bacteroidia bacterium]